MYIVVNTQYGGFRLSDFVKELLCQDGKKNKDIDYRLNPTLIEAIEYHGSAVCSGPCCKLGLAEIPEEATDWLIEDHNGMECIIYVLNGHLFRAHGEVRNVA